jgi:hypothetical protein
MEAQVFRWDDDHAITHDDIISIKLCLYKCNNSRIIGRIFMKFGMDIMPLETT